MNVIEITRNRIKPFFAESIFDNPVLIKELRTRLRGIKGFLIMGGYALLMAVVMSIAYYYMWDTVGQTDSKMGLHLFVTLTWAQVLLLTIITPSISAGAITHEVEKKTMELLALTRLSAGKIVAGKQLAGYLFALMLIICSLPLSGICLMLGGISPAEIAITYLLIMAWTFFLISASVFWSSLHVRTANASGNSVGLAFIYFLFTSSCGGAVMGAVYSGSSHAGYDVPFYSLLNPAWAPYGAMLHSNICGIHVPLALIALVLHVGIGIMLLLTASTHVKYLRVERALSIRLLLIGIAVFITWLAAGSSNWAVSGSNSLLGVFATSILISMIIAASIFATGKIRKNPDDPYINALNPQKAFMTDIGGATIFLLILTLAQLVVFGLTAYWSSAVNHTKLGDLFAMKYVMICITLISMVFFFSAVGVLGSALFKLRKNAIGLVILIALILFAGYGIVLINHYAGSASPLQNLAVFWPMTPILVATDEWENSMPQLSWLEMAPYLTSLIYALMGVAVLHLAGVAANKYGGVQEE